MLLRGYLALLLVCAGLVVLDPVQRFVIGPWAWLRPSSRIAVFGAWIRFMADFVTGSMRRVGGARITRPPVFQAAPGVLLIMNHQSLFDIPLVVQALEGGYPLIVTRTRYGRWIPLISHMTRLYQYPVVDPSANRADIRHMLDDLAETARTAEVPIAIFPEGSRTRDGEIGRFKRAGLNVILRQRPWTIHVLVADGFWQRARFKDFVHGASAIDGRVEHVGTWEWTDPQADPGAFLNEIRDGMVERLERMRAAAPA